MAALCPSHRVTASAARPTSTLAAYDTALKLRAPRRVVAFATLLVATLTTQGAAQTPDPAEVADRMIGAFVRLPYTHMFWR